MPENRSKQPSLMSELSAMTREAVKDIRQTLNQVMFGQNEHAPEQGTPLNPTNVEVYKDRLDQGGTSPEISHNDHLDAAAQRGSTPSQDKQRTR